VNKKLARYRLELAMEKLEAARILFEKGKYKDSISRSYYAMFSAAKALLALRGVDSATHVGVISLFNRYFVKENLIDKKYGKTLVEAKDLREDSDYKDFFIVSKEEAAKQLKDAEEFIEVVKGLVAGEEK
jgi:hypothetical protein